MKVSIVVPVYNTSKYLEECVNSILSQSYEDTEIVLVDDGSTDNSGELCDALAKRDARIRSCHKPNGGLSSARNYGIDHSEGECIAFVDSDDVIDRDMIKVLAENMQSNQADMSGMEYLEFFDKLPEVNRKNKIKRITKNLQGYILQNNRLYCSVRYLYKRDLLENIRFDESIKLGEDQDFIFRYSENVKVLVTSDYNGYFYRQNALSLSGGQLKENHLFDLQNRLNIVAKADDKNKKAAYAHYLKGLLAFWCKGIIYGVVGENDYVAKYADMLKKEKWKILFSKYIELKYKMVASTLLLGKKNAIKIIKKYLGRLWKK